MHKDSKRPQGLFHDAQSASALRKLIERCGKPFDRDEYMFKQFSYVMAALASQLIEAYSLNLSTPPLHYVLTVLARGDNNPAFNSAIKHAQRIHRYIEEFSYHDCGEWVIDAADKERNNLYLEMSHLFGGR